MEERGGLLSTRFGRLRQDLAAKWQNILAEIGSYKEEGPREGSGGWLKIDGAKNLSQVENFRKSEWMDEFTPGGWKLLPGRGRGMGFLLLMTRIQGDGEAGTQ